MCCVDALCCGGYAVAEAFLLSTCASAVAEAFMLLYASAVADAFLLSPCASALAVADAVGGGALPGAGSEDGICACAGRRLHARRAARRSIAACKRLLRLG